jgi:hypothetical protein
VDGPLYRAAIFGGAILAPASVTGKTAHGHHE